MNERVERLENPKPRIHAAKSLESQELQPDMFAWYENDQTTNQFERRDFAARPRWSDDPPIVVDIDMDQDLDVLFGPEIYENDGRGNFTAERTIIGATSISGVTDFDGDGDLDLVTRTNRSVRWRENVGKPSPRSIFVDRQELGEIHLDDMIEVADLDGRGRGNVIVAKARQALYSTRMT